MNSIENDRPLNLSGVNPFDTEIQLYQKEKQSSDIAVTVVVPDSYSIALPNIGHQMVEKQFNDTSGFFADRAYLDTDYSLLKEKPDISPEVVVVSMSYEGSYIRSLRMLELLGVPLRKSDRKEGDPLVVIGGWSVSRNPLPLFEIADIIGVGDSEHIIDAVSNAYRENRNAKEKVFDRLSEERGVIIPSRYDVATENGYLTKWEARNAPIEIYPSTSSIFPHSWYLSPETDYNDRGYYDSKTFFSMEIVDACESKCNFCASGWKDKVRDIQDPAQIRELAQWAVNDYNADLVKLFFPANSSLEGTKNIMRELAAHDFSYRVGSAKAERIDREYIELIGKSGQEKIALAAETGDVDLRKRLGKPGMTNEVLEKVISWSIDAGIPNFDFYMILNLPGEAPDSFDEKRTGSFEQTIDMLGNFYHFAKSKGLSGRMRVCAPNFFPKAGTPFQYAPSGEIDIYLDKVGTLKKDLGEMVTLTTMEDSVDLLSQNIMSRGGIETGELLLAVHEKLQAREKTTGTYTPDTMEDWRAALAMLGLDERAYFDEKSTDKPLPWQHIHINDKNVKMLPRAWEVFQKHRPRTLFIVDK